MSTGQEESQASPASTRVGSLHPCNVQVATMMSDTSSSGSKSPSVPYLSPVRYQTANSSSSPVVVRGPKPVAKVHCRRPTGARPTLAYGHSRSSDTVGVLRVVCDENPAIRFDLQRRPEVTVDGVIDRHRGSGGRCAQGVPALGELQPGWVAVVVEDPG